MIVYLLILCIYSITMQTAKSERYIPFFVMKPHTIINQTLYSYCKEQFEFNSRPMYINLTEWPSGFIYGQNPYENSELDYDLPHEDCTVELRASVNDRIRLVFYSMERITSNDYETDYFISLSKAPCLRVRDNDETTIYDCLSSSGSSESHLSAEQISTNNVVYLELVRPGTSAINDYDDNHQPNQHHLKVFFTTLTRKSTDGLCPSAHQIDCNDSYCVHQNARCNGISECRLPVDETFCNDQNHSLIPYV